jgi:ribosomal protein S25
MDNQTAQTANTVQSSDSVPADIPSSAPEAPASEVTPPLAKDDNSILNTPESQPAEPVETPQTVVNEPLGELLKSNNPEPEPVSIFSPTPAEPVSPKPNLARQLIAKAREAIQNRKRKKIDRILNLFAKRTNITNNQVADFLHVSDATATRYLQILENENKIKQVGKTGKGVKYEKI